VRDAGGHEEKSLQKTAATVFSSPARPLKSSKFCESVSVSVRVVAAVLLVLVQILHLLHAFMHHMHADRVFGSRVQARARV